MYFVTPWVLEALGIWENKADQQKASVWETASQEAGLACQWSQLQPSFKNTSHFSQKYRQTHSSCIDILSWYGSSQDLIFWYLKVCVYVHPSQTHHLVPNTEALKCCSFSVRAAAREKDAHEVPLGTSGASSVSKNNTQNFTQCL